jgi:branched-chain amino acid transport system ATP-binding protein
MLVCRNLSAVYGDIVALRDVNLEVNEGEAVALIGVNGAGKTTLLRAISGLVRTTGEINFEGLPLHKSSVRHRVKEGIAHVPEGRHVFPGLTVKENLEIGAVMQTAPRHVREDLEKVYDLFPRLKERANQLGWSLSGGEQQMLAIGRALMGRPRLLLLDEPSLGLAPRLAEDVYARIATINEGGLTVLLVEQNTVLALGVANRGYVIENGCIVLTDTAEKLRTNSRVRDAYLGR